MRLFLYCAEEQRSGWARLILIFKARQFIRADMSRYLTRWKSRASLSGLGLATYEVANPSG
jgi:hypothetical protein